MANQHLRLLVSTAGDPIVDPGFTVRRDAGAAARRALITIGGNGSVRAFNQVWSHSPTKEAEQALDLVDSRLVEALPG